MGDGRVMGVRKLFQGIPVGMEGFGYKSGPKHQGSEFQAGRVGGHVSPRALPVPYWELCSHLTHFSSLPFIFAVLEVYSGRGCAHTGAGGAELLPSDQLGV